MNSKVSSSRVSLKDEIISGLTALKSISDFAWYGGSLDRYGKTDIRFTDAGKSISRATEYVKKMSLENAEKIRNELNLASSEIEKYAAIQPQENALNGRFYHNMKDQIDFCLKSVDTYIKNHQKSKTINSSTLSTPGNAQQRRSLWELKRDEETGHDIFIEYLGENQPPSE